MFLELHLIQSFAPANLNRDDTNSPKDCEFGGARRARISSQCLKRAIRTSAVFAETTRVEPAIRTRWLSRMLIARLEEAGKPTEVAEPIVLNFVNAYVTSKDKKDGMDDKNPGQTKVLLYLSESEIKDFVEAILNHWDELLDEKSLDTRCKGIVKGLARRHKGITSAPDIALFGRMLADKPELNLEASCQVAHALSTHRISMEMDFYTAVDDLLGDEEAGAGMMGFVAYDSACFYRYARIHWDGLVANLQGDVDLARCTVEGFLRAALVAIPSGKQNSFAAYSPPSLALAVVRDDGMGWSLVNAFERPIRSDRDGGLVRPSLVALDDYWGRLVKAYGDSQLKRVSVLSMQPDCLCNLESSLLANHDDWLDSVLEALPVGDGAK